MDYYMDDRNVLNRLIKEYKKYGTLIVAYDFDNTVYDYHADGHSYNSVIKLLRKLNTLGCYLIVFTASDESKFEFISNYLEDNRIPFDTINKNAPFVNFNSGKIYYNILLDDRAGLKSTHDVLVNFIKYLDTNN